jgi:hypothetical protein
MAVQYGYEQYDTAIHRHIQREATTMTLIVELPARSATVTPGGTP